MRILSDEEIMEIEEFVKNEEILDSYNYDITSVQDCYQQDVGNLISTIKHLQKEVKKC